MKKSFTIGLAAALLMLLTLTGCQQEPQPTEPSFVQGWIRAMPPGMKMTAGFGALVNVTAEPIEIVSFSSPRFRTVTLHKTEVIDGISKMSEVENVALAPGESLEMKPGGHHLMLVGPHGVLPVGRPLTLEIEAADGRVFRFEVPVENR